MSRCSVYQKLSAVVIHSYAFRPQFMLALVSVYIVNQEYRSALIFMGHHIEVLMMGIEFTSYVVYDSMRQKMLCALCSIELGLISKQHKK